MMSYEYYNVVLLILVSFFIEKVSGGQKGFLNTDVYFIEAATRGVL